MTKGNAVPFYLRSDSKKYLLYVAAVAFFWIFQYIIVETVRLKNTGFETKSLWDWMELLIIPFVLGFGAVLINRSERASERRIAHERQQHILFQSYVDRMSDLMLQQNLQHTKKRSVRDVARIQTITLLRILDDERKLAVLIFLSEAGLLKKEQPIIDFNGVDLSETNFASARLSSINLSGADLHYSNLEWVQLDNSNLRKVSVWGARCYAGDFSGSDLSNSYFHEADLSGSRLVSANLTDAYLGGANLRVAHLNKAKLVRADLSMTKLAFADFSEADLTDANLCKADLRNAKISSKQLRTVASLEGAIMPNGTRHK